MSGTHCYKCMLHSNWLPVLHCGLVQQFQRTGTQEAAESGGFGPVHHGHSPPHLQKHLWDVASRRWHLSLNITRHAGCALFSLLPLGRWYRGLESHNTRFRNSHLPNNYHVLEPTITPLILPLQQNMTDRPPLMLLWTFKQKWCFYSNI